MNDIAPTRIGLLIDYLDEGGNYDENVLLTLQLVVDDYVERGLIERPVEFVVRAVQGPPKGSFRAVRDAFYELVEEDALVIFGPWVSENGAGLRAYVEELVQIPCITMGATESMLGEWVFGLPAGSLEEEPIIMATVAAYDCCLTVGLAYEGSLIGQEYLRSARVACRDAGLQVTAEVLIPQVQADKRVAKATLAAERPDAIMHVGFGLGIPGMNAALEELNWMPPRYTTRRLSSRLQATGGESSWPDGSDSISTMSGISRPKRFWTSSRPAMVADRRISFPCTAGMSAA